MSCSGANGGNSYLILVLYDCTSQLNKKTRHWNYQEEGLICLERYTLPIWSLITSLKFRIRKLKKIGLVCASKVLLKIILITCFLRVIKGWAVMLHASWFAATIFCATQHCNVVTMLQPFQTMSQQCCNAVLRIVVSIKEV